MLFSKFREEITRILDMHLAYICNLQKKRRLYVSSEIALFPNILIISNHNNFYSAELVGAVKNYTGLTVKTINKGVSINKYFYQFDDTTPTKSFTIDASGCMFANICLGRDEDIKEAEKRFPSISRYGSKIFVGEGSGSAISLGENCESFCIANSALVNTRDGFTRCKDILSTFIFSKSITSTYLKEYLKSELSPSKNNLILGVHAVLTEREKQLIVAGQLQNMYLFPSMHETSIGEFLNKHPEVIKAAFNTDDFKYEPFLKWIEHDGLCENTAINPDLMIRRDDGFYDIYDLKTILEDKKKTTTNAVNRRKFISCIIDGISQLGYYKEYFTHPKNAIHAEKKYGIKVKNPRLVLVVGSWENTYSEEVKQAMRSHNGVEIIDYDTFCHQFISSI